MDISTPALMSLVALVIVVGISCVNEEMNPGFLGIFFALIVGAFWANITATKILSLFPTNLFLILTGITFLFAIAHTNGTMSKFTTNALRMVKGKTELIPFVLFALMSLVTAIGPGNIATIALFAPVCMPIAGRIKLSAFCMTLIVAGAVQGAAFSPLAPTGIISNGLIAKMAPAMPELIKTMSLEAIGWKVFWNAFFVQGFVNLAGFFVFGGWAWFKAQKKDATFNIDEIAPKPEPYNRHQIYTMLGVLCMVILVLLPGFSFMKTNLPKSILNLTNNVGGVAFLVSGVLMLLGCADVKKSVKSMPWGVLMLVCGVTVLVEVMDQAGGLQALVAIIGTISNPASVNGWLGLFAGIISAYSSSSGVVMPMFLPMVPGLVKTLGAETNPISLISSINVGSHLVDTSPMSILGALCIASADPSENQSRLFRNLMIWGMSMAVVAGLMSWVFYGIFNL